MLGKVMKYELRATGRMLLPFAGLALVIGAMLRLLFHISGFIWQPAQNVMESFCLLFGVFAGFALFFAGFVISVMRFYQGMVSNEAYLTFTLPVKASTHIWGRAWVGLIYTTFSTLVAVALVFIAVPGAFAAVTAELRRPTIDINMGLDGITRQVPMASGQLTLMLTVVGVFLIFCLLITLFQFYASMALGTVITQNRVVGSILGFMILNTIESVISLPAIIVPMALTMGFREEQWTGWLNAWFNGTDAEVISRTFQFFFFIIGIAALVNIVFAIAHYIITKHFFGKKLNLE